MKASRTFRDPQRGHFSRLSSIPNGKSRSRGSTPEYGGQLPAVDAFAHALHALARSPSAAHGDPPAVVQRLAKCFYPHKNKMRTFTRGSSPRADIPAWIVEEGLAPVGNRHPISGKYWTDTPRALPFRSAATGRAAMNYWLDLFTPYTWTRFKEHGATVSGFRPRQRAAAFERIKKGDVLLCYLVKLSRWCGSLEIDSDALEDTTPIFAEENDPFPIRFRVKPLVMLDFAASIPIDELWSSLSFTRELEPRSIG